MIGLAGNIKLHFGAKYMAEDTAGYLLYRCDRAALDGRAVDMARLARFLGLAVHCEYITGDCTQALGMVAFEPQRVYTAAGALDLFTPAAVVERDIIERGEGGLYNFALALMCAEALYFGAKHDQDDGAQLSFGLHSVASHNGKRIELDAAADDIFLKEESAARFALKLLMPKNGFKRQTMALYAYLHINRATLDERKHLPFVVENMAERYNVPAFAVLARMKELNL